MQIWLEQWMSRKTHKNTCTPSHTLMKFQNTRDTKFQKKQKTLGSGIRISSKFSKGSQAKNNGEVFRILKVNYFQPKFITHQNHVGRPKKKKKKDLAFIHARSQPLTAIYCGVKATWFTGIKRFNTGERQEGSLALWQREKSPKLPWTRQKAAPSTFKNW